METVDKILQQAVELEKRAHAFYVKSAESIEDPVIASVLYSLSRDEEIHVAIISRFYEALEHGKGWPAVKSDMPAPKSTIENVDKLIKESVGGIVNKPTFMSVYEKARSLELSSRDYYKSKAESVENEDAREFFKFLTDLENAHLQALDMLVEATKGIE